MPEGISRVIVQDEYIEVFHFVSVLFISAMPPESPCSISYARVTWSVLYSTSWDYHRIIRTPWYARPILDVYTPILLLSTLRRQLAGTTAANSGRTVCVVRSMPYEVLRMVMQRLNYDSM